jgi:hypothetical protein
MLLDYSAAELVPPQASLERNFRRPAASPQTRPAHHLIARQAGHPVRRRDAGYPLLLWVQRVDRRIAHLEPSQFAMQLCHPDNPWPMQEREMVKN